MTPISPPIRINSGMTPDQLDALRKPYRKANKVVLLVDGNKYPERPYPAASMWSFVGIDGTIRFCK